MSPTLASTLVLVGCIGPANPEPPKAVQAWTDEQIEGWVFGDNASMARQRVESRLAMEIQDLDRACKLTDAQKKKLGLAARGDIKGFFERFDEFKRKAQLMQHDQQNMQRIFQEIPTLQATLQGGLFHEDSLFVKSLPNMLTSEQFARYDALARERRASRHREGIAKAVDVLRRKVGLEEAQQRAIIALLAKHTKPSRRPSPYEPDVILSQLDRVPEEKLKLMFEQDQWERMKQVVAGYQRLKPMLKRAGVMPAEDDENPED
jgi:hypothetical protein